MTLRQRIEERQRSVGPLAELFDGLYRFRNHVVIEHFADALHQVDPIIALQVDDRSVRGRYDGVGPLGFQYWITLNPHAYATAADMVETLAHELAHWYCDISGWGSGHGALWGVSMEKLGICGDSKGDHVAYTGAWYELTAVAIDIGLDRILLT